MTIATAAPPADAKVRAAVQRMSCASAASYARGAFEPHGWLVGGVPGRRSDEYVGALVHEDRCVCQHYGLAETLAVPNAVAGWHAADPSDRFDKLSGGEFVGDDVEPWSTP